MGSPAIAALVAHVGFLILFGYGWFCEEIGVRTAAVFLALWIGGSYGFSYLPYGTGMFSSYVAVLDIALVLIIFKGDIRVG